MGHLPRPPRSTPRPPGTPPQGRSSGRAPTPAWDPTTGEVVVPARSITGLDGKTYTRPAPQEGEDDMPQKITRKRTPYPVVVDRAAADVASALERRGQGTFRGHEH